MRTAAETPTGILPFQLNITASIERVSPAVAEHYQRFETSGVLSFRRYHEQLYLFFAVGLVGVYLTYEVVGFLARLAMALAGGLIISCFDTASQAGVYTDFLTKSTNRVFSGCCKRLCRRLSECICECDCAFCCACGREPEPELSTSSRQGDRNEGGDSDEEENPAESRLYESTFPLNGGRPPRPVHLRYAMNEVDDEPQYLSNDLEGGHGKAGALTAPAVGQQFVVQMAKISNMSHTLAKIHEERLRQGQKEKEEFVAK